MRLGFHTLCIKCKFGVGLPGCPIGSLAELGWPPTDTWDEVFGGADRSEIVTASLSFFSSAALGPAGEMVPSPTEEPLSYFDGAGRLLICPRF